MDRQIKFSNRITTYSALAAAFLVSGRVESAIIVTDVNPDVTLVDDNLPIDFDAVMPDAYIVHNSASNSAVILNPGMYTLSIVATGPFAYALASGATISATLATGSWGSGPAHMLGMYSAPPLPFFFPGNGDLFIGVEFGSGGTTYYGWILVNVASGTPSITIKKYAYESQAGVGIIAGEEETSLPVVLADFKAIQEGKSIVLSWTTESEFENQGFILERCATGSKEWHEIGNFQIHPDLEGQGNTTEPNDYQFIDTMVEYGTVYDYRLSDVSYAGVNRGQPVLITNIAVEEIVPSGFSLRPSFPNPFNPSTTIEYTLSTGGGVNLSIYNLKGQLVTCLVNEVKAAGSHASTWQAVEVEAGIYFVELVSGDGRVMQKITLLK